MLIPANLTKLLNYMAVYPAFHFTIERINSVSASKITISSSGVTNEMAWEYRIEICFG